MSKENIKNQLKNIQQAQTAEDAAHRADKHGLGDITVDSKHRGRHSNPTTSKTVARREAKASEDRNVASTSNSRKMHYLPSTSTASRRYEETRQEKVGSRHTANKSHLPSLGQPGGRDDPLRYGLSGAGCLKYIRYIREGFKPEEARQKVVEEREAREKRTITVSSIPHKKRERESITPKSNEMPKRLKVGNGQHAKRPATGVSYANALKITKVAILPGKYPEVELSAEEQTKLEEAIVEEMTIDYENKLKPQFGGIAFRSGFLVVDCETQNTVKWLVEAIPSLLSWEGVKLDTKVGDDIPKPHIITIFFPRSCGQDPMKSVKLIASQNEICIDTWKILGQKDEGPGQIVTIGIDEKSLQTINEKNHVLSYRFGKINVHVKKYKTDTIPENVKETQEITGSTTQMTPQSMELEENTPHSDKEPDDSVRDSEDELLDLTVLAIDSIPSASEEEDLLQEKRGNYPPPEADNM